VSELIKLLVGIVIGLTILALWGTLMIVALILDWVAWMRTMLQREP
jgi:hypothetical protein